VVGIRPHSALARKLLAGIYALPLILATCAPEEMPSAPGYVTPWTSQRCGYSVVFDGRPSPGAAASTSAPNVESVEGMRLAYASGRDSAECVCYSSAVTPKNATPAQVRQLFGTVGKELSTAQTSFEFSDGPDGIKIWDIAARTPSAMGELSYRIRVYAGDRCIFGAETVRYLVKDDGVSGTRFLASIIDSKSVRMAGGVARATRSPDTAQRLRNLQSVFDQKLITATEYEATRKEILSGR